MTRWWRRFSGMDWDDHFAVSREWLRLANNDIHVVEQAVIKATKDAAGPPTYGAVTAILSNRNQARAA